MKRFSCLFFITLSMLVGLRSRTHAADDWVSLFDGKSLDGWKASEAQGTFSVKDGAIVVFGPRSHLYYVGPVANHNFKNFEFKADVATLYGEQFAEVLNQPPRSAFIADGSPITVQKRELLL